MFVLDTNVVSELRKGPARIDRNVERWSSGVDPDHTFLSTITLHELEVGVRQMERRDAKQGAALRSWMTDAVLSSFSGRIIPFDAEIALRCAALHVPDPRPMRDSIIAATALRHGMTVVTRDVRDFELMGVKLLNPWDAAPA
jgi:predicted nucleic acid-binding protein